MFSQYCSNKFTVEPVEIIYEDVKESDGDFERKLKKESAEKFGVYQTPNLNMRKVTAKVDYINGTVGINESAAELARFYILTQTG
jgi:hypothetical protein